MTRIVVTGREGQLVRSLIERAAGRDVELIALGRPDLDLDVPGAARAAISRARPDLVINAAAYTNVDAAEDEPDRAMRINSDAAGEIAAAAREAGAAMVQISTDYVFDGAASGPYAEDAATGPIGVYGRTKLAGERRVRAADSAAIVVRTAWVYSPFGRNFVRTMMTLARTRDTVGVVADQRGNPTSALDLADGLLALADRLARGDRATLGQVYHLAGTGAASWFDLARHVFATCAKLGLPTAEAKPVTTADYPTKAARPANSMLDCARFTADMGFAMPAWREATAATVARIADET